MTIKAICIILFRMMAGMSAAVSAACWGAVLALLGRGFYPEAGNMAVGALVYLSFMGLSLGMASAMENHK